MSHIEDSENPVHDPRTDELRGRLHSNIKRWWIDDPPYGWSEYRLRRPAMT